MTRRVLQRVLIVAGVALALCSALAHAQAYPARPIRIIVLSSPASGPDIVGRLVGQRLMEVWGQQVVVDTRPGASGIIGAEIGAKAAPDGYTLIIVTAQAAIVSAMYAKLPFHLQRDFAPISTLATTPFVLAVHPALPATTLDELVTLAKQRRGQLRYGSGGSGSPPHLSAEIFRSMTGIELVHVPYKGVTPALTDTIAGQVHMVFSVIPAALASIRSGKVRALGITSATRSPLVPEVPAIAEAVPGYEFIGWYVLVAPARTPPAILDALNAQVNGALKTPEFQERFMALGADTVGSTRADAAAFISTQMERMRQAVVASGAKPD